MMNKTSQLTDGFLFVWFISLCILFLINIIVPVKVQILRSGLIKLPGLLDRLVSLRRCVEHSRT